MASISPRQLFGLSLLTSAGLVGGGLFLAINLHLAACPLCIIQRVLYLALAGVSLFGLLLPKCRVAQTLAAVGNIVIAATGAFVAAYQVWLQRFAHDVSCSADQPWWERMVEWAGERFPLLFEANGLCSDPSWKFLNLSIADWSTLAFTGLFGVAVLCLIKVSKTEKRMF